MDATMAKTPTELTHKLKTLFADHPRQALADAFGVHRQAITQYLNGAIPGPGVLLRIARHFKVSLEWLVDDEMPASKPLRPAEVLSDWDLTEEQGTRYRLKTLEAHALLERCEEVDWWKLARNVFKRPIDSPHPELKSAPDYSAFILYEIDIHFNPFNFVETHRMDLPCPDIDPIDVLPNVLQARHSEFFKKNPAVRWLTVHQSLRSLWQSFPSRRPQFEELRKKYLELVAAKKEPGDEAELFPTLYTRQKGIKPVFNSDNPLADVVKKDNESKAKE